MAFAFMPTRYRNRSIARRHHLEMIKALRN